MPVFTYKVRDAGGKILVGKMEAADGKDLRRQLDDKNYFIIEYALKETMTGFWKKDIPFLTRKLGLKEISIFSWQLYTMLNAGVTLTNTLKTLERQTKNEQLKNVLNAVWHRVEEGTSFSEALKEHPLVFSPLYIQMVNAGEVGGVLDEMLRRLALYYERQDAIRTKILSAVTYPTLLLVVSGCVVLFLITFILPRFAAVFRNMGAMIPWTTQFLLALSGVLQNYWFIFLTGILGGLIGLKVYMMTPLGRFMADKLKLQIPIIGDLIRKTTAASFTQTLSILLSGGIPILTALEVVTETIGNSVITKALKDVSARVGEGKAIAEPLARTKIFPEMVVNMIQVGEETGALDTMLEKVSEFYSREVDLAIELFTKLLEPVLIVFMTVVVGFIAVSIFLPMADVLQGFHG